MAVNNANELKAKLEEKKNQVAAQGENKAVVTPQKEMEGMLKRMMPEIERAVSGIVTPERFGRIALSVWNSNKQFWECSRVSFLSSLMKAAQAGLEPNTALGEAYIIPYGKEATFQLGYHGILTLCHRTKQFASIYAHEVYKNDKFEYEYGLEKKLVHVPADVPEGDPIYFYAVYKLKDGGFDFVVWSRDRVIKHAKQFSKTYTNPKGTWTTNFDAMAKKTVLIQVLKYAPKSVELAKALTQDESTGNTEKLDADPVDYAIDVNFEDVQE
jgi:recombination protein RecT